MKGDIYIPRLKYQVAELAPIHQALTGEDREAAYWRTDIGVSENGTLEVEFAPPGPVTWTAGDPVRLVNPGSKAQTNDFTAYINEDTSNVTATLDDSGWTGSVVFKVFEPSGVLYTKIENLPPPNLPAPPGLVLVSARMRIKMTMLPLGVCFSQNEFLESDDMKDGHPESTEVPDSSEPVSASGPWNGNDRRTWHDANESWLPIATDNIIGIGDKAGSGFSVDPNDPPDSGTLVWNIPLLWRSKLYPTVFAWREFSQVTQQSTFTAPNTLIETKGGASTAD